METKARKRILSIDLAKGISSFLIPMAHVVLIFGTTYAQQESWLGLTVHFFGKWAGVFLIAMGFSYTLSSKNTFACSIKKGVRLLMIGYFMNFLKFIVPALLGMLPDSFIHAYGWELPLSVNNLFYMLFTGDILQLAGVCLLLMGVINKYSKTNKFLPLIITALMLCLLEFVRGFHVGVFGIDYVLDLLWGSDWNVYFSVFPWFGFILVGMFFGYLFKEEAYQKNVFKMMLLSGMSFVLIGGFLCYYNYEFHMRDYFHLGIGGFIYLLGFNLIVFWFTNFLVSNSKPNAVLNFFVYCSKRITTMYVIQWVLICWGMSFIGYRDKNALQLLPLMLIFTILTIFTQKLLDFILQGKRKKSIKTKNGN